MYLSRVQANTQIKSESLKPRKDTIKEISRKGDELCWFGEDISRQEWNQAKTHQVHEATSETREFRWGTVVPKNFCPQSLGFPILHGLNAFEVWLEYKPFGEVGTVEMDWNGGKWSGRMRGCNEYAKWMRLTQEFKLITPLRICVV